MPFFLRYESEQSTLTYRLQWPHTRLSHGFSKPHLKVLMWAENNLYLLWRQIEETHSMFIISFWPPAFLLASPAPWKGWWYVLSSRWLKRFEIQHRGSSTSLWNMQYVPSLYHLGFPSDTKTERVPFQLPPFSSNFWTSLCRLNNSYPECFTCIILLTSH